MSDILQRAKDLQRKVASDTSLWIRLALLQELIAEIERLELVIHAGGNVARLRKEDRDAAAQS